MLPNILALIFTLRIVLLSNGTVVGRRTVTKTVQNDLDVIKSFKPDIVLIQLGSNDLTGKQPNALAHQWTILSGSCTMFILLRSFTCTRRQNQSAFNCKAKLLTKYHRVVLKPVPCAQFWGHRGFWRPSNNIYVRDGVHLNLKGQGKFYRNLRGAILRALSLLTVSTC